MYTRRSYLFEKKAFFCLWSVFLSNGVLAAPRSISMGPLMDKSVNSPRDKPQMARDLEGLDPREGGISKGLRGSFTIKHYISGPWKSGTAVIEIASDLSYAEVRIFDREGNLQRIYSIQPKSQNTHIDPAQMKNPLKMVEQVSADDAKNRAQEMNVVRSPQREAAVQEQTAQAVQTEQAKRAAEMADQPSAPGLRGGTVSNAAGDIREGSTLEAMDAAERARESATERRVVRVRHKRHRKLPRSALDTPLSGPSSHESEYYYTEEVVVGTKNRSRPVGATEAPPPKTENQAPAPPTSAGSTPSATQARWPASASSDENNRPDANRAIKEKEAERRRLESDPWKPKPSQVASLPDQGREAAGTAVNTTARARRNEVVSEDLTEVQKAAAKLDSDQWTPKPAAPPPSDAELGLNQAMEGSPTRRSARLPTGQAGSKKSYDDMVPLSDQVKRGGQGGDGSDTWSPTRRSPKLDSKEEQALAMIAALRSNTVQPVVKVNRDINNPEEGVRPFYSLEKYSGAQFGRHREFERRVIYKQNQRSSLKGYDFFIDEVDRKQEKHYLYYYKIDSATKKAKLIATEKHEHVTFLSNYDIGSEDKGKINRE